MLAGGGGGGGGGGAGSSSSDRIKKATQVTAVADSRIQAVIVTAPKDMMQEISQMMDKIDVPSARDQNVYVFKMNNGDPQQALTVLQSMFQSTSSRNTGSSSSSALQNRVTQNATTTSSSGSSTGLGSPGGAGGRGAGGTQF
jgi:type II secretory pathway component GspD/PulD (secretin)